jgi:hypothetical protein
MMEEDDYDDEEVSEAIMDWKERLTAVSYSEVTSVKKKKRKRKK